MGLRETMNNNPAAVTGAAVVILLLALIYVFFQGGFFGGGGSDAGTMQIVYYDSASKTIKLVPYDYKQPYPNSPLDGSPQAFEAALLTCGECPEDGEGIVDGMSLADLEGMDIFIGWLEKRDPGSESNDPSFNESVQYRPFKGQNWVKGNSERWLNIQEKIYTQRCPGGDYATQCSPPNLK